jgi:hypothetical protein
MGGEIEFVEFRFRDGVLESEADYDYNNWEHDLLKVYGI